MKRQTTFDHECELEHFYSGVDWDDFEGANAYATNANVIDAAVLKASDLLAENMAKALDGWVKAHTGDTGEWEDL